MSDETPICTGCWAIIAPNGGVLVRQQTGELMIYGMEVEARANFVKGCTIQRVDVFLSAAPVTGQLPPCRRCGAKNHGHNKRGKCPRCQAETAR